MVDRDAPFTVTVGDGQHLVTRGIYGNDATEAYHVNPDGSRGYHGYMNGYTAPSIQQNDVHSSDNAFQVNDDREALFDRGQRSQGQRSEVTEPMTFDPDEAYHCHVPRRTEGKKARNQLIAVCVLSVLFMVAEIVGGLLSNSLSLVADATHLASDITGFLISLVAVWLARKKPTQRLTYGYYRTEVLGALFSVLIIWIMTGVLVYLAVKRIQDDTFEIDPKTMLITASLGVAFNIIMGCTLHSGLCKKCNVRSKFGHGHSHGGSGHGHSHGGSGHGHSHGGYGHGHSHGANHNHDNINHNGIQVLTDNGAQSISESVQDVNRLHTQPPTVLDNRHDQNGISGPAVLNMEAFSDSALPEATSCSCPHGECSHVLQESGQRSPAEIMLGNRARKKLGILERIIGDPDANINIKAAMAHVLGDLIQSIGVLIAAGIIFADESKKIADPICTFVFAAIVLFTTITVIRDIFLILLEAVPRDANYVEIVSDMHDIEGVKTAHSIHVWALTLDKIAVSAHLAIERNADWSRIVQEGTVLLRKKHGIFQSTLQVEPFTDDMDSCNQCTSPGTTGLRQRNTLDV